MMALSTRFTVSLLLQLSVLVAGTDFRDAVVAAGGRDRRDLACDDVTQSADFLCRPPPSIPDLFAAFAESLHRSVVLYNMSRQLFLELDAEESAPCRSANLDGGGVDSSDCVDTSGSVPCRRAAVELMAAATRTVNDGRPTSATSTKRVPVVMAGEVDLLEFGREPSIGSLEDADYGNWQPAVPVDTHQPAARQPSHPDNRLQQPPAASYQSTVSTGSRAGAQSGPFALLWASLHGKVLIVAVSVSLVAAVVLLAVWIALRSRLSEPKYSEACATEEAVSMYGRVLQQADQQRRIRYATTAATAAATQPVDVTATMSPPIGYGGNHHHQRHHHHNNNNHYNQQQQQQQLQQYRHPLLLQQQTTLGQHEIFTDERTMISNQPVRRYL